MSASFRLWISPPGCSPARCHNIKYIQVPGGQGTTAEMYLLSILCLSGNKPQRFRSPRKLFSQLSFQVRYLDLSRACLPTRRTESDRRTADQSWHARCSDRSGAAAVSQAIPQQSTSSGISAVGVVADSERRHTQHPAKEIGGEVCPDLDARRFAAEGSYCPPGSVIERCSGAADRTCPDRGIRNEYW